MTSEANVKTLDAEIDAARRALQTVEGLCDEEIRAVTREIRERHAAAIDAAKQRVIAAERAKREHVDATASHPWEGKRVFRVRKIVNRWSGREQGEERFEGIVEVRRQNTPIPGNLGWSAPRLGEPFVRKIKKDGKPGSAIYTDWASKSVDKWQLAE